MHFTASAITQDRWDKSGFGVVHLGHNNKELIFGLSCTSFNETLWKQGINFFNVWLEKSHVNLESILSLWNNLLDEAKAEEISAFCLTGEDNEVAFSLLGEAGLYFLQTTQISGIIEGKQPKRFQQIFRGSLIPDSLIVGGTYAMMRLIPQETVKELFRRAHSQNECMRLAQEMSRRYDFALPLLTVAASFEAAQNIMLPQSAQTMPSRVVVESSRELYGPTNSAPTQPPRARLLNKKNLLTAWPKFKKIFDSGKNYLPYFVRALRSFLKFSLLTITYIIFFIKIVSTKTWFSLKTLRHIGQIIIHKDIPWADKKSELKNINAKWWLKKREWYSALPKTSQISLVLVVIISALLIYSIFSLIKKNQTETDLTAINATLSDIDNKRSSAEAALIYDDSNRARGLTQEALVLVEQLPQNNSEYRAKYDLLKRDLTALLLKTEHLNILTAPIQLYALNETAPQTLTLFKGNLYGLEKKSGKIFIFNIKNKTIQTQTFSELKDALRIFNDGQNLMIIKAQELFRLQTSPLALEKAELNKNAGESFAAIDVYNKRLYSLLSQSGKILRFDQTLSGFSKGQLWGNQTFAQIKGGVSLAVDGTLFVLQPDGRLLNCQNGQCLEMSVKSIDLVALKPEEIYTTANSKFLFLLARANKRLIVLDKQGKVVSQYSSPLWESLQSVQIDETSKRAFILANNNIYGISLENLK